MCVTGVHGLQPLAQHATGRNPTVRCWYAARSGRGFDATARHIVDRLDTDARNTEDTMDRLVRGDTQVLVGTQMVAKGLDIPNVTLCWGCLG
ncbi:MAG: hypothetical protein Ct9H300mP11_15020 [Chloroflexota bacterium]|nr:MAG: hypothetical protein Ct9H300mP11_15020 [Chloroflexota bacterium]